MIAQMKRVFVVLQDKDKQDQLKQLRRLGVLHVEALPGSGAAYDELMAARASILTAVGLLSEFKVKPVSGDMTVTSAIDMATGIRRIDAVIKTALAEQGALIREMERVSSWGDFDPSLIAWFAAKGLQVQLVELESRNLGQLPEDVDYITLERSKTASRVLLVSRQALALPACCTVFPMPAKSLSELQAELVTVKSRVASMKAELSAKAPHAAALSQAVAKVDSEIQFEALHSGMPASGGVAYFSAWLPAKDEKRLVEAAAKSGWGLLVAEPLPEEQPPTKIENPAIVRMIQPVFDFLGTVPNYREYDISGWFLMFFTVFFAMIFGDGGYGSLLLLGGIFAALKAKKQSGRVPDAVRLLLLLASATVLWGILTASWFGLDVSLLPAIFKNVSIPWIASYNPAAGANIKQLCFIIATSHLIIAHLKNMVRDRKSLKLLAQVGLLMQVAGMYFLVLNLVLDAVRFPVPNFALYLIGGGFVLNFVFANYEGNIIKSILASFANIVSVFLGVVNVFADVVSYIRLWAVGLAGVAISQTVNSMAGPMLSKALLFAMGVALLLFGHGLNVVMSLLSVIVHGVRLNMLEFSGHLGMEWSGYKYEPFNETADEVVPEGERSLA